MNCKQGDLAVVAKATWHDVVPHLGRIVRCVRLVDMDGWQTEPELEPGRTVYDGALRPIRDNPGEDETLTWAGKPADIKTPEVA